jgi:RND family efflux transporter MFP subunit
MTRRNHHRIAVLSAALLLAAGPGAGARAQSSPAVPESEFDCVIEPKAVVKLGSADEGILKEIIADRGDAVKQGDVVARLDFELETLAVESARLRAERDVEIRSNRARLDFRRREANRAEELYRKKIVSTKVRDEAAIEQQLAKYGVTAAEMDRRMARLELRNAEERLGRRTIRSPVDGVVVEVTMTPGEFAHEQSPVMTVAQIDPLHVEVFVPISHFRSIVAGMPAEVMPEAPAGGVHLAQVKVVDRVFDTASGTFGVRLELPNRDHGLPAGLKCRIRFLPQDHAAVEPEAADTVIATTAEPPEADPAVPEEAVAAEPAAADLPADGLVALIQAELGKAGFPTGRPDGAVGPRTKAAIEAYQQGHQLQVTGLPSRDLLDHIRRQGQAPKAAAPPAKPVGWYEKFRQASDAAGAGKNRLAIELFGEAIDAGSLPPEYRLLAFKQRGHARTLEGLYDQAIEDYDRIVELGAADARTYASRGASYIGKGRYRRAVKDYDAAIGMDPGLARAYHGRGVARANLGDMKQAIDDYRTANRLSPDYADAYFNRAIAYEKLGNLVAAMEDYAKLYELQPDYPGLKARLDKFGLAP